MTSNTPHAPRVMPFPLALLVLFLPAGLWYALIFWFSSRAASASDGQSGRLLRFLLDMISPAFRTADPETRLAASELLSFPVRKCAHMFLFFMLALLLLFALSRLSGKGWRLVLPLCALLATLDEYHQTFVPGRSGEVRDVMVDLCGSAAALLLFALASWGRRRQSMAAFVLLCVPVVLTLAGIPAWPSPAETAVFILGGPEAAFPPSDLFLISQNVFSAAAFSSLGAFSWLAARLAGFRRGFIWGMLPASALVAALASDMTGAAPGLAANLAVLGGVLAAGLWLAVSCAAFPGSGKAPALAS